MATWKPAPSIGGQERLGRRLFDEPSLVGASDQSPLKGLNLRHFRDNREPTLSLDRMGRTNVEKAVVRYLAIRATRAAVRRNVSFHGWVEVAAKELTSPPGGGIALPIVHSPVTGEAYENDNNVFHCHVEKPDEPAPYYIELQLRHIFTDRGRIHYHVSANDDLASEASFIARCWSRCRNLLLWLRRIGT